MPSEARQKKIMEKLNRAKKCSILGPQNLGSKGGPGRRGSPGSAPGSLTPQNLALTKILQKNQLNENTQGYEKFPSQPQPASISATSASAICFFLPIFLEINEILTHIQITNVLIVFINSTKLQNILRNVSN